MLFIQKIVDFLKTPLFANKSVPSLPQAIENAQIQIYDAQTELDYLDTLLKIAQEDKRRALLQGQELIEAAVEADKEALAIESAAHQSKLEQLESSFSARREALLRQLAQLDESKASQVNEAQSEFTKKANDADSRATAAQRELARIQSQLGNAGQQ